MRREIRLESFLANLPLFRELGADSLARLAAGTRRLRIARNAVLFREGGAPTGFFAVVYGQIRLARRGADGAERVVDILGPGKSFGEPVMFLEKPYIVSATAFADSLLVHVSKDTVFAEIERNPKFARRIIAGLARRSEALVRELESYALGSAAERLIAYLMRQVASEASGPLELALPMAKRAVASRLNLSAEHLSRILGELSAKGLIEVRGRKLFIPDAGRLRAYRSRNRSGSTFATRGTRPGARGGAGLT